MRADIGLEVMLLFQKDTNVNMNSGGFENTFL